MAENLTLRVEGMTCTGCEQAIGNALRRVDGVREAAADHQRGAVQLSYDPARTDQQTLVGRIEQAGYRVVGEGRRQR
jgi:copper chaperone CopZ